MVRRALFVTGFCLAVAGCRTPDEQCSEDLRLARKAISKLDYRLASTFRDRAKEHCADAERVEKLSADIEKLKARRAKR